MNKLILATIVLILSIHSMFCDKKPQFDQKTLSSSKKINYSKVKKVKPKIKPTSLPSNSYHKKECDDDCDCPESKPYCLEHDCVKDKPERK
ncbi:hypothetical protein KKH43_06280 [Patescibacteria group bacterium]|nr:hypothetical protein [Patescibacteria group bacterium]